MHLSSVHIAGVGISEGTDASSDELAVSAGIKALLDAGITYADVDASVAGFTDKQFRIKTSCFDAFGVQGAPACEVDGFDGLSTATQRIKSRQANCVLIIGNDEVSMAELP